MNDSLIASEFYAILIAHNSYNYNRETISLGPIVLTLYQPAVPTQSSEKLVLLQLAVLSNNIK